MKVLSLFDGMACGMLAFMKLGINVDRYVAYEIDKFAIKSAMCNFPLIEEMGNVFNADFSKYNNFDFLIGGSPCTYWSIAQQKGRETSASGAGWDLFSQFTRAIYEAKPRYFIYENNKSMSNEVRDSIRSELGFEEICIDSALLSAQTRKRYYWVGKRDLDGTYSRVNIEQPADLGILLQDVLDCSNFDTLSNNEISYMLKDSLGRYSSRWKYVQKPYNREKALCLTSNIHRGVPYNVCCVPLSFVDRDKAVCLKQHSGTARDYLEKSCNQVAFVPVEGARFGYNDLEIIHGEPAEPTEYDDRGVPIRAKICFDDKEYPVYEVRNSSISVPINGKSVRDSRIITRRIKLPDGYYIIRKLTLNECKRLQTVPEWYKFPVSYTQALKQLGNGWTINVISYLIDCCLR